MMTKGGKLGGSPMALSPTRFVRWEREGWFIDSDSFSVSRVLPDGSLERMSAPNTIADVCSRGSQISREEAIRLAERNEKGN
jgi:hypothetical protein